ncbi:MmcQ/YjbR family DNA-binding protein [Micromonospora sp. WMMD729]|uniref:MmcQ/YjbR family DNA-binding protein n=1 Tax=Micromonospora sp. WMMD729 TaxID=3404127 RepID=UPI003BF470F0
MERGEMLSYCLAKPGAWLDRPWEDDEVVKVGSRIFAFLGNADSEPTVGVKCGANREIADEWLHRHPGDARPMPYIGRSGWNTLRLDGGIDLDELTEAVDSSYDMVVAKLPKRERPTA